jgi:hypothetical protein
MSNKFKIEIIEAPMINETKQTAVQWYAERLYDLEMAYNQGVIKTNTYIKGKREAVEQAKEIEIAGKEMSYTEGYSEGYKRALDYMTLSIEKQIKARQNDK